MATLSTTGGTNRTLNARGAGGPPCAGRVLWRCVLLAAFLNAGAVSGALAVPTASRDVEDYLWWLLHCPWLLPEIVELVPELPPPFVGPPDIMPEVPIIKPWVPPPAPVPDTIRDPRRVW